jgi:hypothetical protein
LLSKPLLCGRFVHEEPGPICFQEFLLCPECRTVRPDDRYVGDQGLERWMARETLAPRAMRLEVDEVHLAKVEDQVDWSVLGADLLDDVEGRCRAVGRFGQVNGACDPMHHRDGAPRSLKGLNHA